MNKSFLANALRVYLIFFHFSQEESWYENDATTLLDTIPRKLQVEQLSTQGEKLWINIQNSSTFSLVSVPELKKLQFSAHQQT